MPRRTRVILAWTAATLWASFIWGLGTDDFSMSSTSRFLGPLVAWLAPQLEPAQREFLLVTVRKLAHVGEYAVFALLAGRAIWLAFTLRMRVACSVALVAVAGLAAADELRQNFSAARTGSAYDVGLDLLGGMLAIALLTLLKRALGRPLFETAEPTNPPASETTVRASAEG